jgi:predicted Zn-dependent protease
LVSEFFGGCGNGRLQFGVGRAGRRAGAVKKAIALNVNDPEGYAGLANILSFVNRAAEALPLMEQAVRLDPLHPPFYDMYIGRALLQIGDYVGSLPPLHDCTRRVPAYWPCHAYLAIGLAQSGQDGPAQVELAEMLKKEALILERAMGQPAKPGALKMIRAG